ncbi:MAG: type II secretion system protein [Clostridiaceae bacterium]|jgi:prepilin-type N-terminal cleavage/methylation domain-containing protein|nr:type II secretion system protein [Clostridiaceae bacterium]
MMTTRCRAKKGFTLAELIMAIALLAFFSTMIVQVFAKAADVTARADRLDQAVLLASDLADQWKHHADESGYPETAEGKPAVQSFVSWYDEGFSACSETEAAYAAAATLEAGDVPGLWQLHIQIETADRQELIYELAAGHYRRLP